MSVSSDDPKELRNLVTLTLDDNIISDSDKHQ